MRVRYVVRRGGRNLPAPVFPHDDPAAYRGVRWILVATPDDQIWPASRQLADLGVVGRQQVVLHLSGALDQTALKPLRLTGAALGSMHPLQSVAVAAAASARLPGSFAGLEGDARVKICSLNVRHQLWLIADLYPELFQIAPVLLNYDPPLKTHFHCI